MTREFPSGDISTPLKLTELKNSSSVSFGLFCAPTASAQLRMERMTKTGFRIFIGSQVGRSVIQRGIRRTQEGDCGRDRRSRAGQRKQSPRVECASTATAGQTEATRRRDREAQ